MSRSKFSPVKSTCSVHERCKHNHNNNLAMDEHVEFSHPKEANNSLYKKMIKAETETVLQTLSTH